MQPCSHKQQNGSSLHVVYQIQLYQFGCGQPLTLGSEYRGSNLHVVYQLYQACCGQKSSGFKSLSHPYPSKYLFFYIFFLKHITILITLQQKRLNMNSVVHIIYVYLTSFKYFYVFLLQFMYMYSTIYVISIVINKFDFYTISK